MAPRSRARRRGAHAAIDDITVCARSGADGAYAIDVKAGIYRVEVSGPAGGRLVFGPGADGAWAVLEWRAPDVRTAVRGAGEVAAGFA